MSMVMIRNLDPDVKVRLQERAHQHGRSMEAEVRSILSEAVLVEQEPGLGSSLRAQLACLPPWEGEWPDFEADRSPQRTIDL